MFAKLILVVGLLGLLAKGRHAQEQARLVKRQSGTPTCGQPLYTGVVNENSAPGTFILTAAASSASGSPLTWSIQDTTLQRFSINPSTGAVTVAGSLARAARQRSALEFRIRATDNSNYLYCESTVRVNILPNSAGTPGTGTGTQPYFGQSSYSFAPSFVQFGTQIGQVNAISSCGGQISYTLNGCSSFFSISQNGQITSTTTVPAGTYTCTVFATTPCGTASSTVTINVAGGNTGSSVTFQQSAYTFSSSFCAAGQPIGQVSASGGNGQVTYSLTGTSQFTINQLTGQITANGNLNSGTYTFQVVASSPFGGQAYTTVTISLNCFSSPINNQAPTFSQTAYTVQASSCTPGSQIARVQATSALPVTYSLAGSSIFTIDPVSGLLSVNQGVGSGSYTTQISASSAGGQTSATVTVVFICPNINPPPINPINSYYVTSGFCPAGSQIGSICSGLGGNGAIPYTGVLPLIRSAG
ncbi:hypothetical protein RvY_08137 [Ramazzottius varieornatus]|uniref:Cadherin domain-containing protein n=1 Tax=Ramazzottius varieornatus TaxID=947166 RepID=A0A1D1V4P8_RAMVA|nr:hypothetical protein RvY_08137 [Ramazzottius varieornatus]